MHAMEIDLDASYLHLSGELEHLPRIVEEFQRKGWYGIDAHDLAGHYSLRMLATALRRGSSPSASPGAG